MKLKQFRPRLKTSIEHIANVFSRAPPEFPWIPFQKWFNISYTHNSHTRVFLLLLFFSLHRLQIHSWIPHHPPPTFKDSCGGMGGRWSRWSFSMDLHYLQTGFSRCEIKIGASHQWSHLRLDRSASKKAWKGGGLPLERRTTRAGSFDVFTRHIRALVIRKWYVDSTLQGDDQEDRRRDPFGRTWFEGSFRISSLSR